MGRFYGYNRDDYYFKRSCKEAFGSHFNQDDFGVTFKTKAYSIAIVAVICVLLTAISSYL